MRHLETQATVVLVGGMQIIQIQLRPLPGPAICETEAVDEPVACNQHLCGSHHPRRKRQGTAPFLPLHATATPCNDVLP
jgi:hypothetical protein